MDVVVLAAGQGTRMDPLTDRRPKPLLPVAGRPLVEHALEAASDVASRYVVVVGYRGEAIKDHLGERFCEVPVRYVKQGDQRGTAHAIAQAGTHLDGDFLVLNGDVVIAPGVVDRLAAAAPPALVGTPVENPSEYGVLSVEDGRLVDIVEKPADPPSDLINAGLYRFDSAMLDAIDAVEESERGELEVTDAIAARLDEGVAVVRNEGRWMDVGYPWDLLTATGTLLEDLEPRLDGTVADDVTIEGPAVVEAGATVSAGSVLRGPVVIQAGATVGPNAYVRDGTVVGPDATVGHAVEVKRSLLLAGATASHLSYVGDSVLGCDVNLGAGTTVANLRHDDATVRVPVKGEPVDTGQRKFGVVLGDEVKTGINTSLNVGTVLPTGAMTRPGEVVLDSS